MQVEVFAHAVTQTLFFKDSVSSGHGKDRYCGERLYRILPNAPSFLTVANGNLTLSSQSIEDVGEYQLYLEVSLKDYPKVAPILKPFKCIILYPNKCAEFETKTSDINFEQGTNATDFSVPLPQPKDICGIPIYYHLGIQDPDLAKCVKISSSIQLSIDLSAECLDRLTVLIKTRKAIVVNASTRNDPSSRPDDIFTLFLELS